MPRPCHAAHPLSPETCRACFWCMDPSDKGRAYRALWSEPEPASGPVLLWRFGAALAGHVAGGMLQAEPEEKARRLALCLACPECAVDAQGAPKSCRKCGCGLQIKAAWLSQRCPLGRWEPPAAG
jgi:hypothetical protein